MNGQGKALLGWLCEAFSYWVLGDYFVMYLIRLSSLSCTAKSQVEAMNLCFHPVLLVFLVYARMQSYFLWHAFLQTL